MGVEISELLGGDPPDIVGVAGVDGGADGRGSLGASVAEEAEPVKSSSGWQGSLSTDWSKGDGDTCVGQP